MRSVYPHNAIGQYLVATRVNKSLATPNASNPTPHQTYLDLPGGTACSRLLQGLAEA
jgi:hypothetical protein